METAILKKTKDAICRNADGRPQPDSVTEYFIGDRNKYGVTLMETISLIESIVDTDIYIVRWTALTRYEGLRIQVFPMARRGGRFFDFYPISKDDYEATLSTITAVTKDLEPLQEVKKTIDRTVNDTIRSIWDSIDLQLPKAETKR